MHSRVFVVQYPDDERNYEEIDEESVFDGLPGGADYAQEFSLDRYSEKDFDEVFAGCTSAVEKTGDGFLVTLSREKIRDLLIGLSRTLEAKNKEFRRTLEEGVSDYLGLYRLTSAVCDQYSPRIFDTDRGYQNDMTSWLYDKLVDANREETDTIQFLVTQVFDWHF